MKKTKLYKALDIFIKIAIIVISYYIIYKELFYNQNYNDAFTSFISLINPKNVFLLLLPMFLMMMINWGLEALKWKKLVSKFEKIGFWDSYKAILAGTTVSSIFPNRAGEFIGRVFILKKENIIKGTLVTFVGNISQLLITIIIGLISSFAFSFRYIQVFQDINIGLQILICFLVLFASFLLLYLYFRIGWLERISNRLFKTKFPKLKAYFEIFNEYKTSELAEFLFLSFIRYLVFSLQFFLCFVLFGISVNIFDGLLAIAVIYLLITAIPTVALSELGVRGSVSLFVFALIINSGSNFNDEGKIAIVAASALIWIINLIIPALIGSYFILKFKVLRK